jgi:hypothetical protein
MRSIKSAVMKGNNTSNNYAMKYMQGISMNYLRMGPYVLCTLLTIGLNWTLCVHAQNNAGIGTPSPDPSAILDLSATDMGLLIPRTDTSQVPSPATGLLIFQSTDTQFYYFDGNWWEPISNEGTPESPFIFYGLDNTHGAEIGNCEIGVDPPGFSNGTYCDPYGRCGPGFAKGYRVRMQVYEDGYWIVSAMTQQGGENYHGECGAAVYGITGDYSTYVPVEEDFVSADCSSWSARGFSVASPVVAAGKTLLKDPNSTKGVLVDGVRLPQPGDVYTLTAKGKIKNGGGGAYGTSTCIVTVP